MSGIILSVGDDPEVEDFLAQRIYEYNAATTGHRDAESYTAVRRGEAGIVVAGACGYTWGRCCYVQYLWVSKALRGLGVGSEVLAAVEDHARSRQCAMVLLSSHTFQAPGFYERRGYRQVARIEGHPAGHAAIHLAKELKPEDGQETPRRRGSSMPTWRR